MTKGQRRKIMCEASHSANRLADALRYLDAAIGCASEAGLKLDRVAAMMRADLTKQLERNAEIAGFKLIEFYSKE